MNTSCDLSFKKQSTLKKNVCEMNGNLSKVTNPIFDPSEIGIKNL